MATDQSSIAPVDGNKDEDAVRYRIVEQKARGALARKRKTYRIGDDGSAWSKFPGGDWVRLRPQPTKKGYLKVAIGNRHKRLVHRLVLEAFVGIRPDGTMCCHDNGDPSDNRLANLRWGTNKENCADKIAHGTIARGRRVASAKLTDDDACAIVERRRSGATQQSIADAFGVGRTTVRDVLDGRYWCHATGLSK